MRQQGTKEDHKLKQYSKQNHLIAHIEVIEKRKDPHQVEYTRLKEAKKQ